MAYGKAGRPRTSGWLSAYQAAQRTGISYWAMRQGLANGTAFNAHEIFKVSEGRYLISAAAVERLAKGGGKA